MSESGATTVSSSLPENQAIRVLVVDDERVQRTLVEHYLKKLGQTVVSAANGEEAVRLCAETQPDVVLMDVVMPVMDGYEATRRIKAQAGGRWLPVIFMSALTNPDEQVKGLECGGDDYLTKPVNFQVLASKIQAMRRIAGMQRALADSLASLERYHQETEQELGLARYMLGRLTHSDKEAAGGVQSFNLPVGGFSGDVHASAASADGGRQLALLADVCGHGLHAALSAIPVVDSFFEMHERGEALDTMMRHLNAKLKRIMPSEYFVAAAAALVDTTIRTAHIWSGGMPPALFVNRKGEVVTRFSSRHLPLGILRRERFDDALDVFEWPEPGQIILFSDGLTEAENAAGEQYGMERLERVLLGSTPEGRAAAVERDLRAFLDGRDNGDDVSFVAIDCP